MWNKLRAIWRIVWAGEYFVLTDSGSTSAYHRYNNHDVIKMLADTMMDVHKSRTAAAANKNQH